MKGGIDLKTYDEISTIYKCVEKKIDDYRL